MVRRRANGQRGFVITLELVLIFTILGIGLLVGLVAIRNALFVWWQKKQSHTVWVYDSTPPPNGPLVLGPARDFDEHEAPRLFYIDRDYSMTPPPPDGDPSWAGRNFRAFVGVRDDRFTTRHRIFYTQANCTGVPCITAASDEAADSKSIGFFTHSGMDSATNTFTISIPFPLLEAGGQGYLYALQQGPTYGVGADETMDSGGLPGTLYRQTVDNCADLDLAGGARPNSETILSVWTSQQVVPGPACLNLSAPPIVGGSNCPSGQAGGAYGESCEEQNNTSSNCQTSFVCSSGDSAGLPCMSDIECDANFHCSGANAPSCCVSQGGSGCLVDGTCTNSLVCSCPGWGTTSPTDDWVANGSNCCPPGSTPSTGGGGVGVVCNIATENFLFRAERVDRFHNFDFTPPFRVNLPPDPSSFVTTAPGGFEGAPAGGVTGTYDPDVSFDFDVPASGGESGPP